MQIDIAGKVIVVTGAASGIGRSLALGLAAEGARVAVLARRRDQARHVVDEIGQRPGAPPALALGQISATRRRWSRPLPKSSAPGAGWTG